MPDLLAVEWKWYWRKDEDNSEADCGIYAEPRTGHAYSVCRCPKYLSQEQWEELAKHICHAHNSSLQINRVTRTTGDVVLDSWFDYNHVDAQPKGRAREEFLQLAQYTQNWHPDFNIGDRVKRRGPLGRRKNFGVVKTFSWLGTHLMCTVRFGHSEETFHASEYVKEIK